MDRTLILVKPDAFAQALTGEIIARFERKGLRIVALKHMTVSTRAGRAALRRAQGAPVLRRAGRVHHRRPAGRDGARGPRGREGRAPGDRRHEPDRGRSRLDPRRLRARGPDQPRPRLGLGRVRRARGRAVLSGAWLTPLILASRSPQRRAILEQLGVEFTIEVPDVEELAEGEPRALVARERAAQGGRGRAQRRRAGGGARSSGVRRRRRILAVDTAVVLDGRVYGKPRDEDEAAALPARALRARARGHERDRRCARARGERTEVAVTRVRFRALEGADIDWYLRYRRVARAGRGLRDPGTRGGPGGGASRATTGTWSGCRFPRSCGSRPTSFAELGKCREFRR